MTKRLLFIAFVTAIALAIFTVFSKSDADDATAQHEHEEEIDYQNIPLTSRQVQTANLKMDEVHQRPLDATVYANGSLVLRASDKGEVVPLMGGVVRRIFVTEGQTVRKGQVVATVENTDIVSLQRQYFTACREYEQAKEERTRQKILSSSGAGIKKSLQQSTSQCEIAYANMLGLGRQLEQLGIRTGAVSRGSFTTSFALHAPISGTVSQITSSLGSYADIQAPVMSIHDNAAVECDLNVFEKDMDKVKVGNQVYVSLANRPDVSLVGTVYGMNQYFTDNTRSIAVHVKLKPSRGIRLIDGMYVSGHIATGRQLCNTLPAAAIISADGKNYIFALNGNMKNGRYSFSRHEVTTGITQNGYTAVTLCKHIGKRQSIVTGNAFYLASLTGEHGEEH